MTEREPDRQQAVDAAKGLTDALNGAREDIRGLRRYGRRNRKLIWFDYAATVIAIAATVIALHANSSATQAQRRADRAYARIVAAHESQLSACHLGNQLRAKQVQVWQYVADISSPPPHLTLRQLAANQRKVARALAYIRRSYPQLNCQKLYPLPPRRR